MLSLEELRALARRSQTNERNVVREYVQHLCLSNLYKIKEAQNLLFKGGAALRMIYQSPRFSEDLDFTGFFSRRGDIDELFLTMLADVEQVGIVISLREAKSASGGYLGILRYQVSDLAGEMKFEVSLRKTRRRRAELSTIVSDFAPAYTLMHLAPSEMVGEKLRALIARGKPRDYYDLYFLLRHPVLAKNVDRRSLARALDRLKGERIDFRGELSVLLPVSHHAVLKDLGGLLRKEIERRL